MIEAEARRGTATRDHARRSLSLPPRRRGARRRHSRLRRRVRTDRGQARGIPRPRLDRPRRLRGGRIEASTDRPAGRRRVVRADGRVHPVPPGVWVLTRSDVRQLVRRSRVSHADSPRAGRSPRMRSMRRTLPRARRRVRVGSHHPARHRLRLPVRGGRRP